MPQHHPDIHFLTEFAAGSLCDAHSLCVASHLEHCRSCRVAVLQLNQLGGILFEQALPTTGCQHSHEHHHDHAHSESQTSQRIETDLALEDGALAKVFAAIDRAEQSSAAAEQTAVVAASATGDAELDAESLAHSTCGSAVYGDNSGYGDNVRQLIADDADFRWEKINKSLSIGRIKLADSVREVALHRLEPGGKVGNHDHRGSEITVVLTGSFSDQDGLYLPGDFLLREAGDAHQPIASHDASCVCLSVLEAPVKFTGLSRLINPFLRLKPRAA